MNRDRFVRVPASVLCNPRLSHDAVRIYCVLALVAADKGSPDQPCPTIERIAERAHMSVRKAAKAIVELHANGTMP